MSVKLNITFSEALISPHCCWETCMLKSKFIPYIDMCQPWKKIDTKNRIDRHLSVTTTCLISKSKTQAEHQKAKGLRRSCQLTFGFEWGCVEHGKPFLHNVFKPAGHMDAGVKHTNIVHVAKWMSTAVDENQDEEFSCFKRKKKRKQKLKKFKKCTTYSCTSFKNKTSIRNQNRWTSEIHFRKLAPPLWTSLKSESGHNSTPLLLK